MTQSLVRQGRPGVLHSHRSPSRRPGKSPPGRRIYQQTFIDTYTRAAHVKLYDRKNALVAADLLNDRVLPFFEAHGIALLRILTDRGSQYCGNIAHHEFQLYLAVENIDHSKTKAYHPQTNGTCERFHRTMQYEFYAIAFRKKLYSSLEELQRDVDDWLQLYNEQRPHSGRCRYSKTPMQTWEESLHLVREKILEAQHESFVGQLYAGAAPVRSLPLSD